MSAESNKSSSGWFKVSDCDRYPSDNIADFLQMQLLYGITKYTFNSGVSVREIYTPINWADKYPTTVARFVLFANGYLVHIELRYDSNSREYVWWMQCTKKFDGKEFCYRNNTLTYVVFQSLIHILEKEYEMVVSKKNPVMCDHMSFDPELNRMNLHNTRLSLAKFVDDTGYNSISHSIYDSSIPCTSLILMYAVFCNTDSWNPVPVTESDIESDIESNSNTGEFRWDTGVRKTVTIGPTTETIWFCRGSHLDVGRASYHSEMRSALYNFI
jgi:hypothetical protein